MHDRMLGSRSGWITAGNASAPPALDSSSLRAMNRSAPAAAVLGLFSQVQWLAILRDAGFTPETVMLELPQEPPHPMFLAQKAGDVPA